MRTTTVAIHPHKKKREVANSDEKMTSVIATASQVRVLHYDCHDLQWGKAKSYRVQILI